MMHLKTMVVYDRKRRSISIKEKRETQSESFAIEGKHWGDQGFQYVFLQAAAGGRSGGCDNKWGRKAPFH